MRKATASKISIEEWATFQLSLQPAPPGGEEAVKQFVAMHDSKTRRYDFQWAMAFVLFVFKSDRSFVADEKRRGRA